LAFARKGTEKPFVSILADISHRAAEVNLPFMLIGGNAVVAHGYPRQTQDVDILVRETDRRDWDALMVSLRYRAHHVTRAFHMYAPPEPPLPPVDFMLVDTATFDRLQAGAQKVEMDSVEVSIPSLPHLIALKLHALRQGGNRRPVDLADIVELIRLNQVDLAKAPYPEILERYGTAEIRRKLAILLGGDGPESAGS
jgi:predicted nucleotidyltransferase